MPNHARRSAFATRFAAALLAAFSPAAALADPVPGAPPPAHPDAALRFRPFADHPHAPALEVNILWPFYPGGLVDLRVMVPVLRTARRDFRGELVLGLHSDFAWRSLRAPDAGKVAFLGVKLGYRQFLAYGLHIEASLNTGWRQEVDNPHDHTTLDAFTGRLWLLGGWQYEFSRQVYANLRGGAGIHLYRTDRFASFERVLAVGGDLNLGVRFW